jgi:glycosyltransferase involved in cell wall biosynthesis
LRSPRIALVSHEYPPYQIGGVGSYCYELARFLSKKQIPTMVICGRSDRRMVERVNEYLTVTRLPFPDLPLRAYWFQIQNYSFLRTMLKDFDVVHVVNPQAGAIAAVIASHRIPIITTIHGVPRFITRAFLSAPVYTWTATELVSSLIENPINETLYEICFKRSSGIVAVSKSSLMEAKAAYKGFPLERTTVIPNGIDFERVNRIRRSVGDAVTQEGKHLLFYGRLIWQKGIIHLLQALAILKPEFPSVMLRVIGRGPLLPRVREMIRTLGLRNNVDLVGYLPSHDDVIAEIFKSSIVALPSTYEANSIALLEGMACGKPVVAFDYPFTREVVGSSCGLLARPGDVVDLADKIRLLLNDSEIRSDLARKASQRALRYDWDRITDDYVEVYRRLTC